MNLQDLVYPLAEFVDWSFGLLEFLGNWPNIAIVLVGCVGVLYWLMLQRKFNKEAALNGTLK